MHDGYQPPKIVTKIPGPKSRAGLQHLDHSENSAISRRRASRESQVGFVPVVWERAKGANVWDVDGNRLVDFTAGFGVASVGHRHPKVVAAGQRQLEHLPHAMGDAFPGQPKVDLLQVLSTIVPPTFTGITFGSSGSDAVEAALKTMRLATGRSTVLAFDSGYHGLSLGALQVSGYRAAFRDPFEGLIAPQPPRLPWPIDGDGSRELAIIDSAISEHQADFAGVIMEPVLGRGGAHVPPPGFVRQVADLVHNAGGLLVFDEIFTGFGRTGSMWAHQAIGVTPDILCMGKALGGGFPISAMAARAEVAAAWGDATGEAIHTQTFLGNPVGCAMALASLDVIEEEDLIEAAAQTGAYFLNGLRELANQQPRKWGQPRGVGLLIALPALPSSNPMVSLQRSRQLLDIGWIALPCGLPGDALQFTPPLATPTHLIDGLIEALAGLDGE